MDPTHWKNHERKSKPEGRRIRKKTDANHTMADNSQPPAEKLYDDQVIFVAWAIPRHARHSAQCTQPGLV